MQAGRRGCLFEFFPPPCGGRCQASGACACVNKEGRPALARTSVTRSSCLQDDKRHQTARASSDKKFLSARRQPTQDCARLQWQEIPVYETPHATNLRDSVPARTEMRQSFIAPGRQRASPSTIIQSAPTCPVGPKHHKEDSKLWRVFRK